ncbi:MAG TPA: cyclase family protein [Pyrinomonadaceae bacterium]|jgi:kynurenine formamidase|nr:cyclase family protein [Pyrinomonadaceae bacterium]
MIVDISKLGDPIDISIPLRFDGPQPNAYGVERATSSPCEYGDLVGDTRRGGSCNFERVTLIPHCNGTHTECVGHVTDARISVRDCLKDVFLSAMLVSVEAETSNGDAVITRRALRSPIAASPSRDARPPEALIVRTLPNDDSKLSRVYDGENLPPYFTADAMEYIIECGFKHLLVDLPSIDRLFDEGKLTNHRIFWNIEPGVRETNFETRINSTITELIYVSNDVGDGDYLLNLQIAPFEADAAPSRPVLLKVT